MIDLKSTYIQSPIGCIEITADQLGITSVKLGAEERIKSETRLLAKAAKQLDEYFEKKRKSFDLPLSLYGTNFQKEVWLELVRIPFNKTISYLQLAKQLGDEKSIRAAANANAKNPVAIIVPCHRVIGTNGTLVGYAGELWRKQWLLEHERGVKSLKLEFEF